MKRLISSFILLIFSPLFAFAEESNAAGDKSTNNFKRYTIEYELDAYYSNTGLYVNLTDSPVPDAGDMTELAVYKKLFYSSLLPRFFVVEASLFPMPVTGVFIRKNDEDFYNRARINRNVNLVKAVTAGFEEPYAFNLFLGNVLKFTRPGEKGKKGNFGYMGYLLSVGDYHIRDNELIFDKWAELEWKVKGDQKFESYKLSWSYRIGAKFHDHKDIKDVLYIALRRSRLDYKASAGSIIDNSGIEYRYDIDMNSLSPVRHYFIVDKKLPWKEKHLAASIALGFIWEGSRKYTGALERKDRKGDLQFIIRPNIHF
ncbi:MAG: hypothetical protein OEV42_01655 [Deltaproteobacteria bacterium]|nr:hypothetical protein [Deltaproteobacteria bacterium]